MSTALLGILLTLLAPLTTTEEAPDRSEASIPERLREMGEFGRLLGALEAAELAELLGGPGPFTVLAPRDEAFVRLPAGALPGAEVADRERLVALLKRHVIGGRRLAAEIRGLETLESAAGEKLLVVADERATLIGGAAVLEADLGAANGVIHVVDRVIGVADAEAETIAELKARREAARNRAALAKRVETALAAEGPDAEAKRRAAAEAARTALAPEDLLRRRADTGLAEDGDLEDALSRLLSDLRFRPFSEAPSPAGFPEATPVGCVEIRRYPAHRLVRTTIKGVAPSTRAFFRLFEHIDSNEIAMTSPVPTERGEDGTMTMAFLYGDEKIGKPGELGEVEVVDVAPRTVLSIGMRGYENEQRREAAVAALEAWLARHAEEWRREGRVRTMGWNSPMVSAQRRFWEVQIPIVRAR
ncbi:MAG: heme-binding protein [Planctomycetota bacterium]